MAEEEPIRDDSLEAEAREHKNILGSFVSGIGAVAVGMAILQQRRSNLIPDLLHFLNYGSVVGRGGLAPGRILKKLAEKSERGPLSRGSVSRRTLHDAEVDVTTQGLFLDEPDLVKDVRHLSDTLSAIRNDQLAGAYTERAKDYIFNKHSGHNYLSLFPHDLERVTVGEVLQDQDRWSKLIGKQSWEALFTAKQRGWLKDELLLDPHIFKKRTGQVVDTSLLSLRTLRRASHVVDFFGAGKVIRSLAGSERRFAILPPPPGKARRGLEYFIGETAYRAESRILESGLSNVVLRPIKTGLKLRESAGDPLKIYSQLRQGQAKVNDPVGGFFARLQASIGVGPAYRSRISSIERFLINPIKTLKALEGGEALLYKKPYKYVDESILGRTPLGAYVPELFSELSGGRIVGIKGGGTLADFDELPFWSRLKVIFGLHSDYEVLRKDALKKIRTQVGRLNEHDKLIPNPSGGLEGADRAFASLISKDLADVRLTGTGDLAGSYTAKYYYTPQGVLSGATDFANFLAHRVSSLTSEFGLAAKPSGSSLVNIGRLIAVPVVARAAVETAGYLDFLTEELTGISPIKALATIYAEGRVLQQKLREALGIRDVAGAVEAAYPGLVESEGATLFRSIGLPILGLLSGFRAGGLGSGLRRAAAAYGLFGGVGLSQPSEELREEYEGIRKVPVRKGALWGLGYTPFFGGDVSYFTYSWYHKLMTDYRTKSIYGSRAEYYSKYTNVFGIPFPTPHSLFGLRQLTDPYALEEKHYYDRPYPETAGRFDEFPVIGPILSFIDENLPFIGKERKRMHAGYLVGLPAVPATIVDRTVPPSAGKRLGAETLPAYAQEWEDMSDMSTRARYLAAIATEPLGVYKFTLQFLGVDLEAAQPYTAASAAAIGSTSREFYSLGLGGLFGLTEPIRRHLPPEFGLPSRLRERFNPIRNTMPTFLPGTESEYESDRDYFLDFHHGDPYTLIPEGEARLPGEGYEALAGLHSGVSGVYDAIDRLLILADVAPYSFAFLQHREEIEPMLPTLSEEWRKKVELALAQRDAVVNQIHAYQRYENRGPAELNARTKLEASIAEAISIPTFQKAWDVVSHDFLAEIPYFGSKFFPFRDPLERYQKEQIYGSEFADWRDPINSIIKPAIYDVARTNPVGAALKGAFIGILSSNPYTRILNPIAPLRNPTTAIGGLAGSAFVLSMGRQALVGDNFIPPEAREEQEAFEYIDYLSYLKARSLSDAAEMAGDEMLASAFSRQAAKTLVGAETPAGVRSALTPPDRRYLTAFLQYPEPSRKALLQSLPTYYAKALQKIWYDDYRGQSEADTETLEYFNSHPLPSEDSLIWHPSVPFSVMKIKVLEGGIAGTADNFHKFGFYNSQISEASRRFPNVHATSAYRLHFTDFEALKQRVISAAIPEFPFDKDKVRIKTIRTTGHRAEFKVINTTDRTDQTYYYIQDLMR